MSRNVPEVIDGGADRPEGTLALLERLLAAANAASSIDQTRVVSTLENALSLLVTVEGLPGDAAFRSLRGGLAPWQARRVEEYIRTHIDARVKVTDLAELVGLSYSHFNRAFRASFRLSPTAYIMEQRMRFARSRMLTTRDSLSEVAFQCGLCDQAHFSRMFRRIVGLSPRIWRRQFADGLPLAAAGAVPSAGK